MDDIKKDTAPCNGAAQRNASSIDQFANETKYLRRVQPLYDFFARRKVRNHKVFALTLRILCEKINLPKDSYSRLPVGVQNTIVMQVCQAGTRMVKGSVCVQMYDDSDDRMRWAMQNGALAIVTSHEIDNLPCIVVDNPASVYAKMCGIYRSFSNVEVTAIIGSIGKTSTKKVINAVYRTHFSTFCDEGNENLLFNAGYHCQHIPNNSEVWVQEVSEDTPGYAHLISEMIRPKIAVITAIDKSHIGNFGDEDGIAREVCSISSGMPGDGVVIVNKDDFRAYEYLQGVRVVTISQVDADADFCVKNLEVTKEGLKFDIVVKADNSSHRVLMNNVYAKHNSIAALYAFACGSISGIDYNSIVKGIGNYRAVGIRQNVFKTKLSRIIVYADCYNAVAKSVKTAVDTCSIIDIGEKKRVAVLGDIEESGEYSQSIHNEICDIVNNSKFDIAIFYGPQSIDAAKKFKFRESLTVNCCATHDEINTLLDKYLNKGDLILFKSSRKSHLETCIKKKWPVSFAIETLRAKIPYLMWRFKVIIS